MKRALLSLSILAGLGLPAAAQTWSFPLDPKSGYLRTNNDPSLPPLVLDLAATGIPVGQWIRIETVGAYRSINGGPDTYRSLVGVFSSNSTLLASNVQFRVPGAIAAGPAVQSGPTFVGALPVDIPEDFDCSRLGWGNGVDVQVPAGATHLFLGTHESFYSDDVDPNGDFGVVVTAVSTPTFPGTGEHIVMKAAVNGAPALLPDMHLAPPGSTITAQLEYPLGLIDNSLYIFLADVTAIGAPVPNPLPGLYSQNLIVLKAGLLPSSPNFTDTWSLVVAPGYAGTAVFVQCVALPTVARNGLFESTNAHVFLFQ